MGGQGSQVEIGGVTYQVSREPGAAKASLTGPDGEELRASLFVPSAVWLITDTEGNSQSAPVVSDGPTGLRVIDRDILAVLWVMSGQPSPEKPARTDLVELVSSYAETGQREYFDLAVEMIRNQGYLDYHAAPPASQLRVSLELLLGTD